MIKGEGELLNASLIRTNAGIIGIPKGSHVHYERMDEGKHLPPDANDELIDMIKGVRNGKHEFTISVNPPQGIPPEKDHHKRLEISIAINEKGALSFQLQNKNLISHEEIGGMLQTLAREQFRIAYAGMTP